MVVALSTSGRPRSRRWNVEEYHEMADAGLFRDQRVELIDGRVVEMSPQMDIHSAAILLTRDALIKAFGNGYVVRDQLPLSLGTGSEPEPDISVVAGTPRDYVGTGHPATALLVVEVSVSSLDLDRGIKARVYARAGIADYWIVNLAQRQLEVYRGIVVEPGRRRRARYDQMEALSIGQSIAPLARAESAVAVADLMPWKQQA